MVPAWILVSGLIVVALGSMYGVHAIAGPGLGLGLSENNRKPVIWWHVDDSQVNVKQWLSFEDRATRVPNEPYLALNLKKAQQKWSHEFDVVPVIGRAAALRHLREAGASIPTGAEIVPPALWMPWVRAATLAHLGGLWLDGSVLPMDSRGDLYRRIMNHDVLTFGADADEELAAAVDEKGAPAAGRSAGWAMKAGHPMWVGLTKDIGAVIQEGDQSWSSFEARRSLRYLWDKHCSGVTRVDRKAEVSRDMYGKRLNYEHLFETTEWPNGSTEGALWVPLPDGRDKLEMATPFLWFTRLSEEQILESPFLWARFAAS